MLSICFIQKRCKIFVKLCKLCSAKQSVLLATQGAGEHNVFLLRTIIKTIRALFLPERIFKRAILNQREL